MPQSELEEQLKRIIDKSRLMVIRFDALKDELRKLRKEKVTDAEEIRALRKENETLKLELEYLKVASTISPKEEDRALTAQIISNLMREIDKCISDLKH